jgi:hypothetical protein
VIVSDWPLLRVSFPIGAVHVANTPDALAAAIGVVQMDLTRLRAEAARLRDVKRAAWEVTRRSIEARVGPFTP